MVIKRPKTEEIDVKLRQVGSNAPCREALYFVSIRFSAFSGSSPNIPAVQ